MSNFSNNPGVGLRMTSRRNTFQQQNSIYCMTTPGPQSYDVQFKLTEREKRQNELMSRRYDNWKKVNTHVSNMNIEIGGGGGGGGIDTQSDVELKKVLNVVAMDGGKNSRKRKGDFSSSIIGAPSSLTEIDYLNDRLMNCSTNHGVGLQMASHRIVHKYDNPNSGVPPHYNVEYKLTDALETTE